MLKKLLYPVVTLVITILDVPRLSCCKVRLGLTLPLSILPPINRNHSARLTSFVPSCLSDAACSIQFCFICCPSQIYQEHVVLSSCWGGSSTTYFNEKLKRVCKGRTSWRNKCVLCHSVRCLVNWHLQVFITLFYVLQPCWRVFSFTA